MTKTNHDRLMIAHWYYFGAPRYERPTPRFNKQLWEWFRERGRYLLPGYKPRLTHCTD